MQLTQKEKMLLKDLKKQEKVCVEKYDHYANAASDPQLTQLCRQISQSEQKHFDLLTQIEKGQEPQVRNEKASQPKIAEHYTAAASADKKADCFLCEDALATEKHVSQLYDTCIYEFVQPPVRTVLNQIETEEHGHGKMLYDYMSANHMTN